jgi:hypothetical protein
MPVETAVPIYPYTWNNMIADEPVSIEPEFVMLFQF